MLNYLIIVNDNGSLKVITPLEVEKADVILSPRVMDTILNRILDNRDAEETRHAE